MMIHTFALHLTESMNKLQLFTLSLPCKTFDSVPPLMFPFSSSWLRPPGGLGRGRGLDPLSESGGLAPLQEHLPGMVRHSARRRPVQRCRHGPVRLRHLALCLRACSQEGQQRKRKKRVREGVGENLSSSVGCR